MAIQDRLAITEIYLTSLYAKKLSAMVHEDKDLLT